MPFTQHAAITPISPEFPAGQDAKALPEYEAVTAELAKLNSIEGSASLDWGIVAQNAGHILEKQSKDISIASYLAIALAETEGLEGWQQGTAILTAVLNTWWDDAFPPLKRMRARTNAVDWWHERSKAFLEKQRDPIAGDAHASLLETLRELDAAIADRLPDCQALYDLRDIIRGIPLKPEETPAEAPIAEQPQAAPAPSAPARESDARPAAMPGPAGEETEEQARAFWAQAARRCYDVAFKTACPTHPLAFRALYVMLWGGVRQCPPEENGVTPIPGPDASSLEAMRTQLEAGKGEAAARGIALQLPSATFCLDMHRMFHEALVQAGSRFAPAALVVRQETLAFIDRFPGVEALRFADSTPFADGATQTWLEGLKAPAASSGKGSASDALMENVAGLVAEKRIAEALDRLRDARRACDGPSGLRIRLEEMRLLHSQRQTEAALSLADAVETLLERHRIEEWDPPLCEQALRALYAVRSEDLENKAKARELFARLAVLAPSAIFGLKRQE